MPDIDVNMDLNELFKNTFGEPVIDTSLSFEETVEQFIVESPHYNKKVRRLK